MSFHIPEKYRVTSGQIGTLTASGNNGAFEIHSLKFKNSRFAVIASDGEGWEHVSVSLHNRCPTWDEMCFIKNLFWDAEDCVIQFHPPETDYVNNHPYCLHLWRKIGEEFEIPKSYLVGLVS